MVRTTPTEDWWPHYNPDTYNPLHDLDFWIPILPLVFTFGMFILIVVWSLIW